MDVNNVYTQMQRDGYNRDASQWAVDRRDPVVGSFDAHNAWPDYELLFTDMPTETMQLLDFGCGPGRSLVKFHSRFASVAGADIATTNLEKAQIWLAHNGIDPTTVPLFVSDGISLQPVPDNFCDVIMSTICLQHIAVYDIRLSILRDMFRVVRPGGWITIQMGYGPDRPGGVDYYANFIEATGTNGWHDVKVTDPTQLEQDLTQIGFTNFSHEIRPVGPGDVHNNWIFFRAQRPLT